MAAFVRTAFTNNYRGLAASRQLFNEAAVAHAHLNALNLGTGVIEIGTRLGDAATALAPADTMQLHAEFDLLPVENPELAIVTTTTPDQVIVGAVGQTNENVKWRAHIYVGDLYPNDLAPDSDG